jgi:hypothetical protein
MKKRFGRLTVIYKGIARKRHSTWMCRCDCGATKEIRTSLLLQQITKSCGCIAKEVTRAKMTTHGRSKDKMDGVYTIWQGMRQRCFDSNCAAYPRYGGRGISVCDRWQYFTKFSEDMGPRPSVKHSVDRIDNDCGYYPENCRWATKKEQQRNRRDNVTIKYEGAVITLMEASELAGASYYRAYARLKLGWPVERLFTEPLK